MNSNIIKNRLYKVIFYLSTVLIFNALILPVFEVGNETMHLYLLDLCSSYDLKYVLRLFDTIRIEGLIQYWCFLIVDTIYIFVYFKMSWHLLVLVQQNIGKLGQKTAFLRFAALPAAILDVFENINTSYLLFQYPTISSSFVTFASAISGAKWFAASFIALVILCYFLYWLLRKLFWHWKLKEKAHHKAL